MRVLLRVARLPLGKVAYYEFFAEASKVSLRIRFKLIITFVKIKCIIANKHGISAFFAMTPATK